jgi:hypothetical protein
MNNKRLQSADRRQYGAMPELPFKDSNGARVMEDRRRIPDRRLDNIHADWFDEIVIRRV